MTATDADGERNRPSDLGLLELVTGARPKILDLEHGGEPLDALAEDLRRHGGHLLIWHSRRARTTVGGPAAELREVVRLLAARGVAGDPDRPLAVSTAGEVVRIVWPLGASGLTRWEVRRGLLGHRGIKRLVYLGLGDRLVARLRSGTLVRVPSRPC